MTKKMYNSPLTGFLQKDEKLLLDVLVGKFVQIIEQYI